MRWEWDILLVRHRNFGRLLHRFSDITSFYRLMTHLYSTLILGVFPLIQIAHLGVNVRLSRYLKLISREIIFEYSNLCEQEAELPQRNSASVVLVHVYLGWLTDRVMHRTPQNRTGCTICLTFKRSDSRSAGRKWILT